MAVKTKYVNKCSILAELWTEFSGEEEFADFFAYCDLGLPLAYLIEREIVESTDAAKVIVNETFDLLLKKMDREDEGFESLDELLDIED
jgi:hypothetical protein